jgi:cytochrome c oxidase subunit II
MKKRHNDCLKDGIEHMHIAKTLNGFAAMAAGLAVAPAAFAQEALQGLERIGKPTPNGISLQTPSTEVMRGIQWYDNFLLILITIITIFVTLLLIYVMYRYNHKRNPKPATFTHNSALEIAWTIVPILVLIAMIPPSLNLLFKQMEIPEADLTIKVTGNQWYWSYEYPDSEFGFDSFMLDRDELVENGYQPDEYLLATDTAVVVPVNKTVVVQVTGSDVIHAWAVPAFGVKQDAVPGRVAEAWFKAEKEGIYFGQCSELCGKDHAYMPITVKVVSQEVYDAWLVGAIEEFAGKPGPVDVAAK